MYSFKDENACVKFAKFKCPECNNIVLGHIDEFIGKFETYINRADEMFYANELDHCLNNSGIFYKGTCPKCGNYVHVGNVKYLVLDFTKF